MSLHPFTGPAQLNEPVRQMIGQIPYAGWIYNGLRAGNAIYHYIGGLRNGNYAPDPGAPQQGTAPTTAGGPDPTDPNNLANYRLPGQPPNSGNAGGNGGGPLLSNNDYNAYRAAFAPTYQQLSNPGSGIGPIQGTATYLNPRMGPSYNLMGSNGRPAFAAQNYAQIANRNII